MVTFLKFLNSDPVLEEKGLSEDQSKEYTVVRRGACSNEPQPSQMVIFLKLL